MSINNTAQEWVVGKTRSIWPVDEEGGELQNARLRSVTRSTYARMRKWECAAAPPASCPRGNPKSVGTYAPALPGAVHICARDAIPLNPTATG